MIRILCIPGNGIGPIVVKCGKAIVEAVLEREKIKYKLDTLTLSEKEYLNPTKEQTEKIISTCRKYDYILFGAIGVKNKKQNMYGGGLILALRKELDLYINLRPVKEMLSELNPLENKKFFDIAVVRENTEDAYLNVGYRTNVGEYNEIAVQEMQYTRQKTQMTIKYAFELAQERKKHITLCDKSNVLTYGHGMWQEIFYAMSSKYPDVLTDHLYIDSMAASLIRNPEKFDVIVTTNLFGDILSDLVAELQGGIATAGSLNFGENRPTLVEPVHGAAFDLVEPQYCNPIGMINSIIMMIHQMGMHEQSKYMWNILKSVLQEGEATPDLGGTLAADEFTLKYISKL